jgi:hypothetical protein
MRVVETPLAKRRDRLSRNLDHVVILIQVLRDTDKDIYLLTGQLCVWNLFHVSCSTFDAKRS